MIQKNKLAAILGYEVDRGARKGALVAHGVFGLTHGAFIAKAGVPVWWPQFCLTFDVTAAEYLAWLLRSGRIRAAA